MAAACDGLRDLLPTQAGGIKILLRVAFDVGRTPPPWLDLIPQSLRDLSGSMCLQKLLKIAAFGEDIL